MPPRVASVDGPDPIDILIGERIRARRRWLGLSQAAVANRLGVTFQQVQKYERGKDRVSASTLVRLAVALEMTVAELFGETTAAKPVISADLATPEARQLLAAFAAIPDGEMRAKLVAIAKALQAEGDVWARHKFGIEKPSL